MKIKNRKIIFFSCLIFSLIYFVLGSFYFGKEISFKNQEVNENFAEALNT